MLGELGYWRILGEAPGAEPVHAMCAPMEPEDAVRLTLTAARAKNPDVQPDGWRFWCRRLDVRDWVDRLCFTVENGRARRLFA